MAGTERLTRAAPLRSIATPASSYAGHADALSGTVTAVDSLAEELAKRHSLMHVLAQKFASTPTLTREWLKEADFGWGPERLIDESRGIRNPSSYVATLTIISDPLSDYADGYETDSLYRYSYERARKGGATGQGSNIKLREAMRLGLPIVMLRKVATSQFVPVMPVYVVKDEPEHERFLLALDESLRFVPDPSHLTEEQRRYADRVVRQRLHQPVFRAQVLNAYQAQCAVCVLRKVSLLDAAHITPDHTSGGAPEVPNGLALCKIHHAAYDNQILGISPDYEIHINASVMDEIDGPMLKHGLQAMQGRQLWIPRRKSDRPNQDRLAERFAEFRAAG